MLATSVPTFLREDAATFCGLDYFDALGSQVATLIYFAQALRAS